nr:hypothetical protein [Tanacetum cinerariifolium]
LKILKKRNCPRLGNKNQGNQDQAGNGNAVARAYRLGTAGGNLNANVVTGGNFLDKILRECLSIIESKSKLRYLRSRVTDSRVNTNAPPSSSPSNSFDLQQIATSLEDKLDIRMS